MEGPETGVRARGGRGGDVEGAGAEGGEAG